MKELLRENIKQIIPYSSARSEYKGRAKVFLDANENPFDNQLNRYPDPAQQDLKKIIGSIKLVETKNIFLGNGSDEVLDLLFRAYCNPGLDNVICLPPTYGMYKVLASINNVEVNNVPLKENFQLDLKGIMKTKNDKTKIVFICSPNNPTGNSINPSDIETLLSLKDCIVVIDEAYIDFATQASFLQKLNEYPNLVICQTLSKAYGMAGLRLGMCFASEEIVEVLNNIKPPYNINTVSQERGICVLSETNMKTQVEVIVKERRKLETRLSELGFVKEVFPSDANFLLVKFDNAIQVYNYLCSYGIITRNRSSQHACENCLRITIGTQEENNLLMNTLINFR